MSFLGRMSAIIKYCIGFAIVFAVRLVPFRPPNVEPILATAMPFSKRFGAIGGFLFAAFSIALFDLATGMTGQWTLITALTYGLVAAGASLFFSRRLPSALNFALYGIIGTLAYDAITGVAMGPILFGQSFTEAFFGQIPFTLWHLLGTTVLSLGVSPLVYRWVLTNQSFEFTSQIRTKIVIE